ncbi:MAG: DUF3617 family protein [Deltaproteobacteria bacterium]|nr:DUF3617 family protein [Deltaproteobacteria bacterium]
MRIFAKNIKLASTRLVYFLVFFFLVIGLFSCVKEGALPSTPSIDNPLDLPVKYGLWEVRFETGTLPVTLTHCLTKNSLFDVAWGYDGKGCIMNEKLSAGGKISWKGGCTGGSIFTGTATYNGSTMSGQYRMVDKRFNMNIETKVTGKYIGACEQ